MFTRIKFLAVILAVLSFSISNTAQAGRWVQNGGLTACGQKAMELLSHAEDDGLNPSDFTYGVNAVHNAMAGKGSMEEAERQINDAVIRYIDQIRNGRFDPKTVSHLIVMRPEPVNAPAIIQQGLASGGCEWLAQQEPPYEGYRQLKPLLKQYRQLAAQGNWPQLPTQININPGFADDNLPVVRQMLGALGYLDQGSVNGSSDYDEALLNAVKDFQGTHGLLADGKIGPLTAKEFNKTPNERVRQIVLTMERWRWMPRNPGAKHIKVNIAGFVLEGVESNQVTLRSPIIVGTDYRETPVFTAQMTEVKFNPSWNVPRGLAIKDKLPKIREDPSYLSKNHFVLTRVVNGRETVISPHSVNWHEVSSGNFNFHLRQTPGDHNALGKIRFTINSPFDVFMHSTPDKYLFDYPVRAFSSGCIRVKKVAELGEFALGNKSAWPTSRIEQEMQGRDTKVIKMNHSIPVYVMYNTVWVDENGKAHFMADIYNQDAQLGNIMKRWL